MKFTNSKSYPVRVGGAVVAPGESIGETPKPKTKTPPSSEGNNIKSEEDKS